MLIQQINNNLQQINLTGNIDVNATILFVIEEVQENVFGFL